MAERGHTSSMTSVTEYDSSIGSESDTTESSLSNVTSSVLSSTDTDDKLTPSLGGISISAQNKVESCKESHNFVAAVSPARRLVTRDLDQCNATKAVTPYAIPMNKKHCLKNRRLLHSVLRQSYSSVNVNKNALHCDDNLGVTDKDNKLSTDFSDTSSVAGAKDQRNGLMNATEDEEDYSGKEESDQCRKLNEDDSNVDLDERQSWEPDMSSSTWFHARCFDRYWSHYGFVMAWYSAHMNAVHKLHRDMMAGHWSGQPWGGGTNTSHRQHTLARARGQGKSNSFKQNRRARRARSRRSAKARRKAAKLATTDPISSGPLMEKSVKTDREERALEGEEEEEMKMEITEDMMAFFTTSLKHRMERDIAKTSAVAGADSPKRRVNIEDAVPGQTAPSSAPPQERPGARRALEMKELYGAGAPMVHGMETALQMTFDRIKDKFQPKLWPNMPLKIVFG